MSRVGRATSPLFFPLFPLPSILFSSFLAWKSTGDGLNPRARAVTSIRRNSSSRRVRSDTSRELGRRSQSSPRLSKSRWRSFSQAERSCRAAERRRKADSASGRVSSNHPSATNRPQSALVSSEREKRRRAWKSQTQPGWVFFGGEEGSPEGLERKRKGGKSSLVGLGPGGSSPGRVCWSPAARRRRGAGGDGSAPPWTLQGGN